MENVILNEQRTITNPSTKIKIVDALSSLLFNSYVLCLKTFNCLWNIQMDSLSKKILKEQFNELENAVNEISNRIRNLGYEVHRDFEKVRRLSEINFDESETAEVVEDIINLNRTISIQLQNSVRIASEASDINNYDFFEKRREIHNRNINLIRNIISNEVKL